MVLRIAINQSIARFARTFTLRNSFNGYIGIKMLGQNSSCFTYQTLNCENGRDYKALLLDAFTCMFIRRFCLSGNLRHFQDVFSYITAFHGYVSNTSGQCILTPASQS